MKYFLLFFLLLPFVQNHAQSSASFAGKMNSYGAHSGSDQLFVHTDKHIYTNNEWIWFSAYLLNTKVSSVTAHRFVSMALVQAGTRQAVIQKKFLMEDGLSQGSFNLPDSIAPGEYKLICYTNMMGPDSLPLATFTQKLSVRTIRQSEVVASMNGTNDSTVYITVTNKNTGAPVQKAEVMIRIDDKNRIRGKTDKNGLFTSHIPHAEPGMTINAQVKYKSDFTYIQTQLPKHKEESLLDVRFYPEGGHLLAQMPCTLGWESKTDQGVPLAVKAVLYKNDQVIGTLYTDETGLGSFTITPDPGARYYVQVKELPEGIRTKTEKYPLPEAERAGITLQLPVALAEDSLFFQIYSAGHKQVKMVVHNFRDIFTEKIFTTQSGGIPVRLSIQKYPPGLTAITLFDEEDRPVAERIFFAHYNDQAKLQILPAKETYKKREKITLRFQLSGNNSVPGIASISCAQANRFENSKQRDIESFAWLEHKLQDLPPYTKDHKFTDTVYLEKTLLVRGWRKYNWQAMLEHSSTPKPVFYSPSLAGKVQGYYGRIKKPLDISIIGGVNMFKTLTSDEQGNFKVHYDDVLISQDEQFIMFAKRNGVVQGLVEVVDPFSDINQTLAGQTVDSVINAGKFLQHSRDLVLSDFDKANYLPQYTVRAKKETNDDIYGAAGNNKDSQPANACGDYVCIMNILNCRNHPRSNPGTRSPVKGELYGKPDGGNITYLGCRREGNVKSESEKERISWYDGIKIGKEFYGEDFSTRKEEIPEFISTIYWSSALMFNARGMAECSFYTSDITGPYRIVVNGVAGKRLFFATTTVEVK